MCGYLCIGYLDSYDDHDYLRTASLTMAIHPRLGFLDIGIKGRMRLCQFSPVTAFVLH